MRRLSVRAGLVLAAVVSLLGAPSAASAAPINDFHDVTINGWVHIKDDERHHDDIDNYDMHVETLRLLDTVPKQWAAWSWCQGDEVYVELHMDASRIADRPGWVKINAKADLYEMWDCPNDDHDGTASMSFEVPPNTSVNKMLRVDNHEKGSEDYAEIHFTVASYFTKTG
ncbi:hypothetical protein [Krasilnikovia sp. MM14-A1259]|uniref:hypothetical protein n=1 Tax=Krasilnikovia sp. MM14-A1259 TaxID=3373539 RepID=UPI0038072335